MTRSMTAALTLAFWAGSSAAQTAAATAAYCAVLKDVAALAPAGGQFASISGSPREGSFSDTKLPLPGWGDCSLYGTAMYTCDAHAVQSAADADALQAKVVDDILSCFAGTWLHRLDRSSPTYAVLHPARGAASITLSVDETDEKQFVVRLTLFARRSQ
jgi:hypothetical protein